MELNNLEKILEEENGLRSVYESIQILLYKLKSGYIRFVHGRVEVYCKLMGMNAPDIENLEHFYIKDDIFIIEYDERPFGFYFPKDTILSDNFEEEMRKIIENEKEEIESFKQVADEQLEKMKAIINEYPENARELMK